MNNLDKQISDAERDLDAFAHGGWTAPEAVPQQTPADRLHALLVDHAKALQGYPDGSPERAELAALTEAIKVFEEVLWPNGKG